MTNPPKPARQTRSDGWTRERQRVFLAALADCGSVAEAARAAQMSRQAAYALRRHPDARGFRAAWDEALVDAWRRVAETALERVINGETEVIERDGEEIVRRRPCAPHLVVHMLDRAERVIARTRSRDNAEAERMLQAQTRHIREEIRMLSRDPAEVAAARDRKAALPRMVRAVDGETLALRRHHALLRKLPDLSAKLSADAGTAKKRQLRQLMSGAARPPDTMQADP
jgi:hypothetical protein